MSGLVELSADARSKTIGGNFRVRAWCYYDQNADTVGASGNISSISDDSTGKFTVNFAHSMPDTNYCVSAFCNDAVNNQSIHFRHFGNYVKAVGSLACATGYPDSDEIGNYQDEYTNIAIIR